MLAASFTGFEIFVGIMLIVLVALLLFPWRPGRP
jgi:hypothetical protein